MCLKLDDLLLTVTVLVNKEFELIQCVGSENRIFQATNLDNFHSKWTQCIKCIDFPANLCALLLTYNAYFSNARPALIQDWKIFKFWMWKLLVFFHVCSN